MKSVYNTILYGNGLYNEGYQVIEHFYKYITEVTRKLLYVTSVRIP